MWTDLLMERVLVPDESIMIDKIVAYVGYASPHFARDHVKKLDGKASTPPSIEVILGMTSYEGIGDATHREFCEVEAETEGHFKALYRTAKPHSHMKVYVWIRNDVPVRAFIGSANYSRVAFNERRQAEIITDADPVKAFQLVQQARLDAIRCSASDVGSYITIIPERSWRPGGRSVVVPLLKVPVPSSAPELNGVAFVELSLLQRNGEIHDRGGLNWGQRPEAGRDPNQAYIPVPTSIQVTDFFPGRDIVFTLITDDGVQMKAHVSGAGGKNLTSVPNSALGAYFRRRLGLLSGERVCARDLESYGRTSVEIYRLSEDMYYMVFDN